MRQRKIRKFQRRNRGYKENPMKILKWKNKITNLTNSIDSTIAITQPEQKREHILKKNREPGTVGSVTEVGKLV